MCMANIIQATTLRNNFSDTLDAIEGKRDQFLLIARKNKISAALVNLDLFEDLLALASPKYLKSIKQSREQIKKGKFLTNEQVFGEI